MTKARRIGRVLDRLEPERPAQTTVCAYSLSPASARPSSSRSSGEVRAACVGPGRAVLPIRPGLERVAERGDLFARAVLVQSSAL